MHRSTGHGLGALTENGSHCPNCGATLAPNPAAQARAASDEQLAALAATVAKYKAHNDAVAARQAADEARP